MNASSWPLDAEALTTEQERLGSLTPPPWRPGPDIVAGGCFVAFARGDEGPGRPGDRAWAAAVAWRVIPLDRRRVDDHLLGTGPAVPRRAGDLVDQVVVFDRVPAAYAPGLLALREAPILTEAVEALAVRPDVLLVDATGRDHPRRAGLAVHLGAVLDLPTVGVTHRPLVAGGSEPAPERGATSAVVLGGDIVGRWVRTAGGVRPVLAHAAWRTDADVAAAVVLACSTPTARTPIPLQEARRVAREVRAGRSRSGVASR